MKSMIILASLIVQTAFAANASRVDVKSALQISEGDYKVISADSAIEKENLCLKDLTHKVKWAGTKESPILLIGAARVYMNFNSGLVHEPASHAEKSKCEISHTTQTVDKRIVEDDLTNCAAENTTSHTEIKVSNETLEYSQDIKVSRDGKVVSIPAKCTLQKIAETKP